MSAQPAIAVEFQYRDAQGHDHLRVTYPWRDATRSAEAVWDQRLGRTILDEALLSLPRVLVVDIKRAVAKWAESNADNDAAEREKP